MDVDKHPVARRAGEWAACILAWLCVALVAAAVVFAAARVGMVAWDMLSTPGQQFPDLIGLP